LQNIIDLNLRFHRKIKASKERKIRERKGKIKGNRKGGQGPLDYSYG
jgi:hypothetical protein